MDIIFQNPFRVLGIPVTATDREIAKQINDIAIYAEMDKIIEYDSDNFFSIKPCRTSAHIQEAKQQIEQPNNKLFYSLFWFWENAHNTIDIMAFDELKNGNYEKAYEFWKKGVAKGITSENYSNLKNLSILILGLSTWKGKLKKGNFAISLSRFGKFFTNGHLENFANKILGLKHSVDLSDTKNHFVDEIISMVKPHLSQRKSKNKITHKELLSHFYNFPESIQNDILDKFLGKNIHNIERQVDKSERNRKDDGCNANIIGIELYKTTKNDIKQLGAVLPQSAIKYQLVVDKLAEEILQCSIDYFNISINLDIEPGGDALKLVKIAKNIVIGEKSKNRINENYDTIKEYINEKPIRNKINPIISILNDYQDKVDGASVWENYNYAKEFVFKVKRYLDDVRLLLRNERYGSSFNYIKDVLSACAGFVNSCAITIANSNSQYGRAIELVDMARRIILYNSRSGELFTINKQLLDGLVHGRSVLEGNITNADGLLIRGIGGLIRAGKRNKLCGCGSGNNLNQCCSV